MCFYNMEPKKQEKTAVLKTEKEKARKSVKTNSKPKTAIPVPAMIPSI